MKIFISYGHDDNERMVELIERDLQAAGHITWRDRSSIKVGDDWRRSIVDGLKDTDWTIAFLSAHSVRDPGVCLAELQIVLHEKGGGLATVLLEKEVAAAPPVSVSHIQWLDMQEWQDRISTAEFGNWYQEKLDALLGLLKAPQTERFSGEIAELDRRLAPITQAADIGQLTLGFVGREWLHRQLEAWRNEKESPLLWLSGGAGTGKSAFAAWLAHFGKVDVIGINLCRYNDEDRRDAARVIRTISFQIASRLPDYRRLLLDRLESQDLDGANINSKSAMALFAWILVEPLNRAIDGGRRASKYVVVIDGLDETLRDGRSELAEVLSSEAAKLPAWISCVVTSRPEEPIKRQLAAFRILPIDADANENIVDLQKFVRRSLSQMHVKESAMNSIADSIVEHSEGNFLYARMFFQAVKDGLVELERTAEFPQGLVGLYERWFFRAFPTDARYQECRPVLEILAASEQPVPLAWIGKLLGWSKRDEATALDDLPTLFERRLAGITPFHKSLRDWLVDPTKAGARFFIDQEEAVVRLGSALWEYLPNDSKGAPLDSYLARELPRQILRLRSEELVGLLKARSWISLIPILVEEAARQAEQYAWQDALAWWQMIGRLAGLVGDKARHADAYEAMAGIFATIGDGSTALDNYRKSLSIRKLLNSEQPKDIDSQIKLSRTHLDIGEMLTKRGNPSDALAHLRKAASLAERTATAMPQHPDNRRNVSSTYWGLGHALLERGDTADAQEALLKGIKSILSLVQAYPERLNLRDDLRGFQTLLGRVAVSKGDSHTALKKYEESLVTARFLTEKVPAEESYQRSKALAHNDVADVLKNEGQLSGALEHFRQGLAIVERLLVTDPNNVVWQRDLSISFDRIGGVLKEWGRLSEAMSNYVRGLSVAEKLAKRDPSNAALQRDLICSHLRVGDIHVLEMEASKALQVFLTALKLAQQLVASDTQNPTWQYLLASICRRIGELNKFTNRLDAALAAYTDQHLIMRHLSSRDSDKEDGLVRACIDLGDLRLHRGEVDIAIAILRSCLEMVERFKGALSISRESMLGEFYAMLGMALKAKGEVGEATTYLCASLEIAEKMARERPEDPGATA